MPYLWSAVAAVGAALLLALAVLALTPSVRRLRAAIAEFRTGAIGPAARLRRRFVSLWVHRRASSRVASSGVGEMEERSWEL